jgi:hypothetical protein
MQETINNNSGPLGGKDPTNVTPARTFGGKDLTNNVPTTLPSGQLL